MTKDVAAPNVPYPVSLEQILASEALPPVPVVASNVLALCNDPDVDFKRLGAMLTADAALVAKILRMANSPFFAARRKITTVNEALVRMGLKVARMAVLSFTLEGEIGKRVPASFEIDRFWRHSLTTAASARVIAEMVLPARRDDAFSCGILQDIGMVIMQCVIPETYEHVFEYRREHPTVEIHDIEARLLGITHMEAGAELLKKWGLPDEVSGPIRFHHNVASLDVRAVDQDIAKLARILTMGSLISSLFYKRAKGMNHLALSETAHEYFGLKQEALDRILERVAKEVRNVCDLFNLDPSTIPSYEDVRSRAAQEVARLAVELSGDAQAAESRAAEHMAELEQLKAETDSLKKLAATDELTALVNRREFLRLFAAEIARSRRHGHNLSLVMFDIDHFKKVNDTYGHPAGDKVLAGLGRYLAQEMRCSDIVGRLGGEEFILVLPESDLEGAIVVAEKLRLGVAQASPAWAEGVPGITVSVGLVHASHDSAEFDTSLLIDHADQCLYQAKNAGRNCTRYAGV